MERVCGTLEQESSRLTQTMGETVFELYTSLKILKGFREFLPLKLVSRGFSPIDLFDESDSPEPESLCLLHRDAKMLALTGFHNWFKSSIHQWLQIVHERSCDRIRKAVETDKVTMTFKVPIGHIQRQSFTSQGDYCYYRFVMDLYECM